MHLQKGLAADGIFPGVDEDAAAVTTSLLHESGEEADDLHILEGLVSIHLICCPFFYF